VTTTTANIVLEQTKATRTTHSDEPWPAGWWILPALPLGIAGWVGIFILIF